MKSLPGMGRSTIREGCDAAAEVATFLPEHCLGAIKGCKKLSEF